MIQEVCLSVTSKCNLSCKHCLASLTEDMSLDEIKNIIDQLGEEKIFRINIFGGEPLVRTDLYDILDHIKKYPINMSINTNATLVDENNINELMNRGLRAFTVSLDGSDEKTSSLMRGEGGFDKTVNGIKIIKKNDGYVGISTILSKTNKQDIENIIKLGMEIKADTVRFNALYRTGDAIKNERKLFLDILEQKQMFYEINELMKKYGNYVTGSYVDNVKLIKKWENEPPMENVMHVQPCGAGTVKINIKPNGKITACELMWDNEIGDLRKTSLREFLRHSESLRTYKNSFEINEHHIGDCIKCIYRAICYTGHRCTPYYLPTGLKDKSAFCISDVGPTEKPIYNFK